MKSLWSRLTDPGPTCTNAFFQMGHPGTTPLPAPSSLGNCNSSTKEDALSSQTEEGSGRAERQVLACQEFPGPPPTKNGQTKPRVAN